MPFHRVTGAAIVAVLIAAAGVEAAGQEAVHPVGRASDGEDHHRPSVGVCAENQPQEQRHPGEPQQGGDIGNRQQLTDHDLQFMIGKGRGRRGHDRPRRRSY